MAWNPLDAPVNYILLAEKRSPGIAEVVGAGSPRAWDERQGMGLSGAIVVYTGDRLAKFSVKLRLYTPQDWADWEAWRPLVAKPPRGTRPKALDIWHPFLEQLGIKSVVVEDVFQPVLSNETGEWTVEIKFIQFRAPKPSYAKPEGSKATTTDPVDKRIEELTNQVQKLSAPAGKPLHTAGGRFQ